MPPSKRIIITVPENLLYEVDKYMAADNKNRSEVIRDAIKFYIGERKRELMREHMKRGYTEMAEINLNIACESIELEDKEAEDGEDKLLE